MLASGYVRHNDYRLYHASKINATNGFLRVDKGAVIQPEVFSSVDVIATVKKKVQFGS